MGGSLLERERHLVRNTLLLSVHATVFAWLALVKFGYEVGYNGPRTNSIPA